MTVPYGWSTWGLHWSLREVLVDAALGRGGDYIMLEPARYTRQERAILGGQRRVPVPGPGAGHRSD
jgi:hypothetical protein